MSAWQQHNLSTIQKRLATVQRLRSGLLFEQQSSFNHVVVRRTGDQLLLCYRHRHNTVEEIQSRLSLSHPLALLSEYTQAMLLALAWRPEPQRLLLIGLGGGRLQMVLHHYLEQTSLYTIELDPLVLETTQRFFGFALDERQHVFINDGRAYLRSLPAEAPFDLLMLDAYRAGGVPLHLSTREFYEECRTVLAPNGVIVANLHSGTSLYDSARKTFASAFRYTAAFPLLAGNVVVIGSNTEQLDEKELKKRVTVIQKRYGFDFALSAWAELASTPAPYRPNAQILRDH
jgi:spermidine synthase